MTRSDADRPLSEMVATLEDGPAVIAPPTQVLTGHPIGPRPDGALCSSCGAPLHETDIVFAYAYRCTESEEWSVSRLYCYDCAPTTIRSPRYEATEVIVGGRLGTIALPTSRTHRQCLTELALRAFSPPMEGRPP